MSKITNEDLLLLYYGEHEDTSLAAKIAASPELTARFETLCAELGQFDQFAPPELEEDYGADTWLKISPKLAAEPQHKQGFWAQLKSGFARPRLSLAGAFSLVAVVALAFVLGRETSQPGATMPTGVELAINEAITNPDTQRLLTSSVSGHLEQVNLVLTEFAHTTESSASEAERATDMLVANRLYRKAAQARGDHVLAAFLGDLEPMLIELAYEAYKDSPATRGRMQQDVKDNLLFKVRLISQQLNNSTLST